MKAVLFDGPGSIRVEQRSKPEIEQPGDAIVRVTLSALCGSDVSAFTGRSPKERGTIGHEFVGVVESAGEGVLQTRPGQRVVSPFSVFCGGCFYCKQGLLSACESYQIYGRHLPGAQAEYVRVPNADAVLEPVPDGVSDEQAVFLAHVLPGPFAGLDAAGLKAGDSVVVLGCGPTGLCAQLLARTMGAGQVVAVDHHADRLAAASEAGATPLNFDSDDVAARVSAMTNDRGADLVVEAVGTAAALSQAVGLVRPWGTVLSLGVGIEDAADFPIGRLTAKQARLISSGIAPVKNFMAPLSKMIARGVIDPRPLATHTLPLEDARQGYELMARRQDGALKVLLRP